MRARLFTILPLLLAPAAAAAQADTRSPIDRGSWLVSGGASFARTEAEGLDGDDNVTTSLSIQPNLLFFLVPRLAVGGQVGYARFSSEGASTSSWWLGPAARYYFGDPRGRVLPYLGASAMRQAVSFETDDSGIESDGSVWEYEGVAGLTFMLSRHVGIAAEGFATRRTAADGDAPFTNGDVTTYGIRFGVAAFVPPRR